MANKFQKSVLERLEQEQKRQKEPAGKTEKPPKQPKKEKPVPEIAVAQPEIAPELELEPVQAEPVAAVTEPTVIPDISAFIEPEQARLAKNKTFYLDSDVIEALKAAAKQSNMTDSKLCNSILRRVLGLGSRG